MPVKRGVEEEEEVAEEANKAAVDAAEEEGEKKQQFKRPPRHVSKIAALKDDVFDCGRPDSAAQFEKSNTAIIEYIRQEGTKENILIANALETGVAPTIPVPAFPLQIADPINLGQMINNQGKVFIWQSTMPIHRVNLEERLIGAYAIYLSRAPRLFAIS